MFLGEIFGPDLLIVVIVVAVLLFGSAFVPKFARNLGSAKTAFEKGLREGKTETTDANKTGTDAGSSTSPPTS